MNFPFHINIKLLHTHNSNRENKKKTDFFQIEMYFIQIILNVCSVFHLQLIHCFFLASENKKKNIESNELWNLDIFFSSSFSSWISLSFFLI